MWQCHSQTKELKLFLLSLQCSERTYLHLSACCILHASSVFLEEVFRLSLIWVFLAMQVFDLFMNYGSLCAPLLPQSIFVFFFCAKRNLRWRLFPCKHNQRHSIADPAKHDKYDGAKGIYGRWICKLVCNFLKVRFSSIHMRSGRVIFLCL